MSTPSQRVALVTGASSGIGAAAAHRLATEGWHVVASGRSAGRLATVAEGIRRDTGADVETVPADFAVLDDVHRLARAVAQRHPRLDLLANNAGVLAARPTSTVDGHELTMQVNYLAPYLLTRLLWDQLGPGSRVVNTGSIAYPAGRIDPDDLSGMRSHPLGRWTSYAASKLGLVLFTAEMARRHPAAVAVAFHPGPVRSNLFRANRLFRVSPEVGARRLVYLAKARDVAHHSGEFYVTSRPRRPAANASLAARLWDATAKIVGT